VQLANTDELALGGFKSKKVKDVDGIERLVAWTLAVRQKRTETIAQKQDAALLDDAADRVAAAIHVDELRAAEALLKACDAVLQADAAQKPALRLARTDAERVLKWTHRVRDAPASAERVLLDAATAVVTSSEADRTRARLFYEQLESSWKKPRVSRRAPRQCRIPRSTRSPRQSLAVAPQSQSLRGRRGRSPKTQAEAKDLERLKRATEAFLEVRRRGDYKAALAALEFQLAAKDVVDAVEPDAKASLRITCAARERDAMRACPDDILWNVLCPCPCSRSSQNACSRRRRRRISSAPKLGESRTTITISKPARACGASPRTPATPRPSTPCSLV
jgi:hypothetical protein